MADLKHEQALDEMQQNQPQQEFSQDHIVRRLISKFRKPSDASAIGLPAGGSSNLLQVPQAQHGGVPTVSGLVSSVSFDGDTKPSDGHQQALSAVSTIQRSMAGKQSRWSQLVASAAAGAASKGSAAPATQTGTGGSGTSGGQQVSSTRSLLDISHGDAHGESSSNRSSADGRDDEVDENYFRPGGKGHQALLDNMDKR